MVENLKERASTLIEALPYIRRYHGQTMVIKFGGNAMKDNALKHAVMTDIVLLHYVGVRPILVHGGGPEITRAMKQMGKEATFVNGLRVTDEETIEIAEMVLVGKISQEIVQLINQHGGKAVGLSGKDGQLLKVRKMAAEVDLGYVGEVESVDPKVLDTVMSEGYIPVLSSIGAGSDGHTYNLNADHLAGAIAAAVRAVKLVMMTDVPGILNDRDNPESLLSELSVEQAQQLIARGTVDRGMIPKVEACLTALAGGVERTHVIDGTLPHAVLMEIFTDLGIGTMIRKSDA